MPKRAHIEALVADEEWTDAFMGKIEPNDGPLATPCWEWQGGLDRAGYGRIHVKKHCEKKSGRNFFSHRMCYMIHRGYIEPEEFILHQCHNRLCCNPDHHKLGDHNDNMDDLANSRRIAGENNPRSKLCQADVYEILELYFYGDTLDSDPYTVKDIVEVYTDIGITSSAIRDIVSGRTWKDIYDDFWEDDEDEER